jgi:hypothetical protein
MGQSVSIWHTGAVSVHPLSSPCSPSLGGVFNTAFQGTYTAAKAADLGVVGATDLAPFVVAFDSVLKARFICLRVTNGSSIKVLITSPSGTDQAIKVSSIWIWHSPNPGDEITAIKLVGTADIEIMIAGDVS